MGPLLLEVLQVAKCHPLFDQWEVLDPLQVPILLVEEPVQEMMQVVVQKLQKLHWLEPFCLDCIFSIVDRNVPYL